MSQSRIDQAISRNRAIVAGAFSGLSPSDRRLAALRVVGGAIAWGIGVIATDGGFAGDELVLSLAELAAVLRMLPAPELDAQCDWPATLRLVGSDGAPPIREEPSDPA